MERKYFNKNLCYCDDCIFNHEGRCLCYVDEMKCDERNNCLKYSHKRNVARMSGEDVKAFIGGDKIKLPMHLLRGDVKEQTRLGKRKVEVTLEHPYANNYSVFYNVKKNKIRSSVFNIDIIEEELKRRDKEWKSQVRQQQRLESF